MAVDAAEPRVAGAAEVPGGLAEAAPPRAAHVGRDVPHAGRVVGRHGDRAAVNDCRWEKKNDQNPDFFWWLWARWSFLSP